MLMQGQPPASPHDDSMSDDAIDIWLDQAAENCQQHQEARQQLPHQLAVPSASAAPLPDASATAVATDGRDSMLGSLSDSQQWFDSFSLTAACGQGVSQGRGMQTRERGVSKRWGPPAPPQYHAMLRGELALAVMGGVAGKSLIKEVGPSKDVLAPCQM